MAVLKFVLVILLCIPLVYFIWKMFTSLVNDLDQQTKYNEKLRKKSETGRNTGVLEKQGRREKKPGHGGRFREKSFEPERPRDRETMRTERMKRRNSYSDPGREYPDPDIRRPEPPRYRPDDYERRAEERDRGFRW